MTQIVQIVRTCIHVYRYILVRRTYPTVCIVVFCRAPEGFKVADGKPSLHQSSKLNTPVLRAHVDYSANRPSPPEGHHER